MARTSRLPGFYKVTVAERRALIGDVTGTDTREMERAFDGGGLDAETADKFVENVVGTYALPFGVALNVRVNGKDYVVCHTYPAFARDGAQKLRQIVREYERDP